MKVYIIIKGTGEYSDRYETPVMVYASEVLAEAMMAKLDGINKKYDLLWQEIIDETKDYNLLDGARERSSAEYEALGFDAHFENDWRLEEAPFNEEK